MHWQTISTITRCTFPLCEFKAEQHNPSDAKSQKLVNPPIQFRMMNPKKWSPVNLLPSSRGAAVRSLCRPPRCPRTARCGKPITASRISKTFAKRVFPCHKWQASSPVRIATPRFPGAGREVGARVSWSTTAGNQPVLQCLSKYHRLEIFLQFSTALPLTIPPPIDDAVPRVRKLTTQGWGWQAVGILAKLRLVKIKSKIKIILERQIALYVNCPLAIEYPFLFNYIPSICYWIIPS